MLKGFVFRVGVFILCYIFTVFILAKKIIMSHRHAQLITNSTAYSVYYLFFVTIRHII